MSKRRTALLLATAGALVLAVTALRTTASRGGSQHARASALAALSTAAAALPRPARPAFVVGTPFRLRKDETRALFAPVAQRAIARGAPAPTARPVAELVPTTPEGTTNIVLVL